MSDQKMEQYRKEVSDQAGVEDTAKKLAELDTKLELHQGKMFARVRIYESSHPEQIGFGVTDEGDEFSGLMLYSASAKLVTGVFKGMKYQEGKVILTGEDMYDWGADFLYLHNGPSVERWSGPLPVSVQVVQAKDEKDGVLVWNGNLPVAYTDAPDFYSNSAFSPGERYAPDSLPRDGLESVAVVIGNEAIAGLFGLGHVNVSDTRDLYQKILTDMGMDPDILLGWDPENHVKVDFGKNARVFDNLKERIGKIPGEFFKGTIFDKYEIGKPEGYNMTLTQRMEELLRQAKEQSKEA